MDTVINEAFETINEYSPLLAHKWLNEPFNRFTIAQAFAQLLMKNPEDDIHPVANVILKIALLDRERSELLIGT